MIQPALAVFLTVALIHISIDGIQAAEQVELDQKSEGNLASGIENPEWRIVREAGRKSGQNKKKSAKTRKGKPKQRKRKSKQNKKKSNQNKKRVNKNKKKLKKSRKKPGQKKLKKSRKKPGQKKSTKTRKKKQKQRKRKSRQKKKKQKRRKRKLRRNKKKSKQNKKRIKKKKKKSGQHNKKKNEIFGGHPKQACDVAALCKKIKDFIKISNQLRKVKRIVKACDTMDKKSNKSATEFDATAAALDEALGSGRMIYRSRWRRDEKSTEEVTGIRDNLKKCKTTAKAKCEKTSVEACQNAAALTKCETELQAWLTKFGPAKGSCLQASADCCTCINNLSSVSADCLNYDAKSTAAVNSKKKCVSSDEAGSFGYCRKLQQQAAEKGPGVACTGTSATATVATSAPATTAVPTTAADSNYEKCCPRKNVGGVHYTFSHESSVAKNSYGCANKCVYMEDGGDGSNICFKQGDLETKCLKCKKLPGLPKKYCQPGQDCWPKPNETNAFSESINGTELSCLGLRKFVSKWEPYAHEKVRLPYTGLLNNISGDINVCKWKSEKKQDNYLQPDPNCNANPFITGALYSKSDDCSSSESDDQTACMTPYQFLNNRNYKKEWMAAFIVTTNNSEDISKAIIFANKHNLSIAVMATGHDLQDRNAGPGPNSLLIRTTCFREFKNITNNTDIVGYKGTVWSEGYAIVGAGLTFGRNFWWKVKNAKGLYPLAAEANREIVGGSCHSVGIVGWTLGGGKGWTTPMYGLGVDNLLHVDMVSPKGTITSANYSHNEDLFWAVRGGGAGFGVITSLKIKLHKPFCETMDNCYSFWNTSWVGPWTGKTEQIDEIKHVFKVIFKWTASYNYSWNSLIGLSYNKDKNTFSINVTSGHFGTQNTVSFDSFEIFRNLTITNAYHTFNGPIITNKYWCEIFPDAKNSSNCELYPWTLQRWSQSIRFLVNSSTTLKDEFLDKIISYWQPLCDDYTYSPCSAGFQFHYFFPSINQTSGKGVHDTGGAISDCFRNSSVQVFNTGVNSNTLNLTFDEQEFWMHYTLAPAMYKFSECSYYNEAEYTLDPGQWEERFWGKEKHCKLLGIKKKYDPDYNLNCRHCVGSEVGSEPSN